MKRRTLLKSLGIVGLGSMFSWKSGKAGSAERKLERGACWLTPSLAAGPYYFDPNLVREDIRTDNDTGQFHDGIQLNMTFKVINVNCDPIPNVLVDIWHNDADGLYSGYVQPHGNTTGQDFMRGIQMTNANGECSFITSYPGWYPGRATHIHFKVRLNAFTYVTSQFAFPDEVTNAVYTTPFYVGRGQNPVSNASDGIFGNVNMQRLMMEITANASTGGYDGIFTIGIDAPTGIEKPETGPQGFSLRQNYPNPFNPTTTIEYHLAESSNVDLRVYNALGHEIAVLAKEKQAAGAHQVVFDAAELGSGFYFYRLTANDFAQTKEMLLIR